MSAFFSGGEEEEREKAGIREGFTLFRTETSQNKLSKLTMLVIKNLAYHCWKTCCQIL